MKQNPDLDKSNELLKFISTSIPNEMPPKNPGQEHGTCKILAQGMPRAPRAIEMHARSRDRSGGVFGRSLAAGAHDVSGAVTYIP